jgi:hypothetical protein
MNFVQARFTDVVFKGFYSTAAANPQSTLAEESQTLEASVGTFGHHQRGHHTQGGILPGGVTLSNPDGGSSDEDMRDEYEFD